MPVERVPATRSTATRGPVQLRRRGPAVRPSTSACHVACLILEPHFKSPSPPNVLFSFGIQDILCEVQNEFPRVAVFAYVDDIHLCGPDKDVAAAFKLLRERLATVNMSISFGPTKTAAWSPAWEGANGDANAASSTVLNTGFEVEGGPDKFIQRCNGGIKTLGTYIGTTEFVTSSVKDHFNSTTDGGLKQFCEALQLLVERSDNGIHIANVLLDKCVNPKTEYLISTLPLAIAIDTAATADDLTGTAYANINSLTPAEFATCSGVACRVRGADGAGL